MPPHPRRWETFLGSGSDSSTILIRWPDGSRDHWGQLADSKLQALDNHVVMKNFPRRQLNMLDTSTTLKEMGLSVPQRDGLCPDQRLMSNIFSEPSNQ